MVPKKHRLVSFLMGGVFLIISSCNAPSSSQVQTTLPGAIWEQSNILNMTFTVPDTNARYDACLDLRLTKGYAHSYLSISLIRPEKRDTLWLSLAGQEPISSGVFTDYRFALDTTGFSANAPLHTWHLSHNMPEQTLSGIAMVGLLIKKHGHGER
ncbi:MAG TPA: hypothetical protein PLM86_05220 [Bacteroidales bacterium]|nr:MAG: hypothetical protein BWX93_01836 [Bacteroidetes bacterium ADurb.Bin139]HOG25570.1 hypothetical protein [Bacteroidales bacterium]HQN82378.1 hypothetical protein [Bacteroidales bacterium]